MNFKLGDVCEIVDHPEYAKHRQYIGMECTLLSDTNLVWRGHTVWKVSTLLDTVYVAEAVLRLKRPPFEPCEDGFMDLLNGWRGIDCPWQGPNKVRWPHVEKRTTKKQPA